jgi:hypothetical protein
MLKKSCVSLLAVLFLISLVGCATDSGSYDPARSTAAGTLGGAAVGAALGSIIGAAAGAPGTGAWVGAAAGGLLGGVSGYLYANHQNRQMRNAQAAQQTYGYTPSQGNVLTLEQVSVSPQRLRAGEQLRMDATYTLLTPENQPTSVTIVREVYSGGTQVVQPYQVSATNPNGTFSDSAVLTLPQGSPAGSYTVVTRVMTNRGSAEKTASFSVN